jgi:hypothetical protein
LLVASYDALNIPLKTLIVINKSIRPIRLIIDNIPITGSPAIIAEPISIDDTINNTNKIKINIINQLLSIIGAVNFNGGESMATPTPNSILNDIKKLLGIDVSYTVFDPDIIIHINSVLRILNQLGVGTEGYRISTEANTWDEFIGDEIPLDDVKSYIYMKVRMLFDPPNNSFLVNNIKELCSEFEWRLNAQVDRPLKL